MNNVLIIEFFNKNDIKVECKYVKDFDIKEEYIINQSIKIYITEEPCIIYRTLIRNKILILLEEYFRNQIKLNHFLIQVIDFPEYLFEAINFSVETTYVKINQ